MYCITDEQIDYILDDIRRRGIETEDLQYNLLDHICCIIEQEFKENDDFERFYQRIIPKFYKKELREIEEETINLLTFKNYYTMKKLMMLSGTFSVIAFIVGSFFKIMYWPGAGPLLISAIVVFSLLFLPLLFLLKTKEANNQRDKWILGIGSVVGVLYCLSTLFLIQHWPGSRIIWLTTLSLTFFVFMPAYFFTGIRKPETKMNTIVTTVLLMGFLGLQFTITAIRNTPQTISRVYTYLQTEALLDEAQHHIQSTNKAVFEVNQTCEQLKQLIMQQEVGITAIPQDFERKGFSIKEKNAAILTEGQGQKLLAELKVKIDAYNAQAPAGGKIPLAYSVLDPVFMQKDVFGSFFILNNISQLQLYLANTPQPVVAAQ
jgi:hypothetical protein